MITDMLSREHQVVLEKLAQFEKALEENSVPALRDVVRFFDERLVIHRRKEEEVLFPVLRPHFPPNMGPVVCMLEDHALEKDLVEGLRRALEQEDRANVLSYGRSIISLLRNHIWKEDHILFPMAEKLLDAPTRERVREGFESIGCCCPECGEQRTVEQRAAK